MKNGEESGMTEVLSGGLTCLEAAVMEVKVL